MIVFSWIVLIVGSILVITSSILIFFKALVDDSISKIDLWLGLYIFKYPKWLILLAVGVLMFFLGRALLIEENILEF